MRFLRLFFYLGSFRYSKWSLDKITGIFHIVLLLRVCCPRRSKQHEISGSKEERTYLKVSSKTSTTIQIHGRASCRKQYSIVFLKERNRKLLSTMISWSTDSELKNYETCSKNTPSSTQAAIAYKLPVSIK